MLIKGQSSQLFHYIYDTIRQVSYRRITLMKTDYESILYIFINRFKLIWDVMSFIYLHIFIFIYLLGIYMYIFFYLASLKSTNDENS